MAELESISKIITTYGVIPILILIIWYLFKQNKYLTKKNELQNKIFQDFQKENHNTTLEREKQVVAVLIKITAALKKHNINLKNDDEN